MHGRDATERKVQKAGLGDSSATRASSSCVRSAANRQRPDEVKVSLVYTCNAGFGLAEGVMAADGSRLVQVACRGALCQNFPDELPFTFTVRWRGGKARTSHGALTALASNKLLHLCSTLAVGDHICSLVPISSPARCSCVAHILPPMLLDWSHILAKKLSFVVRVYAYHSSARLCVWFMQAHGRRFAAASSLHVVARPTFVTLELTRLLPRLGINDTAMASILRNLGTVSVSMSRSRTSTPSRAYSLSHNKGF